MPDPAHHPGRAGVALYGRGSPRSPARSDPVRVAWLAVGFPLAVRVSLGLAWAAVPARRTSTYDGPVPSEAPTSQQHQRAWRLGLRNPTPQVMRRWALAGVLANAGIMLSGAVVRLTESGLGCPSWPRCTGDSLVPVRQADVGPLHMAIEFGNRMLTTVVLAVAVGCVMAAARLTPRRRSLLLLAAGQLVGVLSQALLGGVTVLTGLHPATVAAHYLLSAAIIAAAVALHQRAREGDAPPRPLVRTENAWLAYGIVGAVGVVLVLGTIVTGAGPHGGDPDSPRFGVPIPVAAQVHASAVWATLGLTLALVLTLRVTQAPLTVRRRAALLLALELAQGALGYTQYVLEVPEVLVWLHILGSVAVWVAVWRVVFALRDRGPATATSPGADFPASTPATVPASSPTHL